jgi:hypothetical protein
VFCCSFQWSSVIVLVLVYGIGGEMVQKCFDDAMREISVLVFQVVVDGVSRWRGYFFFLKRR